MRSGYGEKGFLFPMDERYRRNPEFILREIAGESILVPTGQAALAFNGLASLNASGVFLWGLLERERSLAELGLLLAREYGLAEETARADAAAFLQPALERNVVLRC